MSVGDGIPGNSATVRFILDGETIELRDVSPTRTVLRFLREDLRRTGTKEGCAEGDCGACTVVVVDAGEDGGLSVRAVNACIQFLAAIDGKELLTVESLKGVDGSLHPVQTALVDCHASQCGFCTPGFAMSMFALYKNATDPSRREIDDALAGNLCRCTGYRPIVAASSAMFEEAARRESAGDWRLAPNGAASSAQVEAKRAALAKIRRNDELAIETAAGAFYAPRSLEQLAERCVQNGNATLLGGGTDVGLWVTKQHRHLPVVIHTAHVPELQTITSTKTHLEIGAAVSVTDAMDAIVDYYPMLQELFLRYGSPPIRNAATLGGNVANGSPIGDSMPVLLALGASLLLHSGETVREVALDSFYLGYQQTALAEGEFLRAVRIPLPVAGSHLRSYKVSKRFDQDISAVCAGFYVELAGETITRARLAFGGMAAIPLRAGHCEAALAAQPFSESAFTAAAAELPRDFRPISDARASDRYRLEVCANLLQRFWVDCGAGAAEGLYAYGRT